MSTRRSSKMLRKLCLERDNYTCSVCGLREPAIMEVDHIIPRYVSEAGYDEISNLVTLCPNDHRRKTLRDFANHKLPNIYAGKPPTEQMRERLRSIGFQSGDPSWAKGKKLSEEHRRKLSESHRGKVPWNKGMVRGLRAAM